MNTKIQEYYFTLAAYVMCGRIWTNEGIDQIVKIRPGKTLKDFNDATWNIVNTAGNNPDDPPAIERYAAAIADTLSIDTTQSIKKFRTNLDRVADMQYFIKTIAKVHRDYDIIAKLVEEEQNK